jgi:hypothetical protein
VSFLIVGILSRQELSDDDRDFIIDPDSEDEESPTKTLSPEELDRKVDAVLEAAMDTGGETHFSELLMMVKSGQMSVDHPHSILGLRALMCAAYWGRFDYVCEFTRSGASTHFRTWGPTTDLQLSALDWAQLREHINVVDFLKEAS